MSATGVKTLSEVVKELKERLGDQQALFDADIKAFQQTVLNTYGRSASSDDVAKFTKEEPALMAKIFHTPKDTEFVIGLLNGIVADKTDKTDIDTGNRVWRFQSNMGSSSKVSLPIFITFIDCTSSREVSVKLLKEISGGSSGSSSVVYSGEVVGSASFVAIKIEPLDSTFKQVSNEARILKRLAGLKCKGVPHLLYCGEEKNGFGTVLVSSPVGITDLASPLRSGKVLAPKAAAEAGSSLVLTLASVHKAGVVHRDIKPSNVIITQKKSYILADYGISLLLETGQSSSCNYFGFVGSPQFASLAALTQEASPSVYDDLESLAYTLLYLVSGSLPWDNETEYGHISMKQRCRECPEKFFPSLPRVFILFLQYVVQITDTKQVPNYKYMQSIFHTAIVD